MNNDAPNFNEPTMRWDFFFRRFNRDIVRLRSERNVDYATLELPKAWTCEQALRFAREHRAIPVGAHNTGCFQVQNDLGIYNHVDANKIDFATPRKAAKVEYKTWEQVEAEELAATA